MTATRKIIHFDADCFYAAVEMRDNPALADVPLAVGGGADRRGVIATCNYAARSLGIKSAMPTRYALQLCPSLVIVPPDFARYKQASNHIFAIYRQFSRQVEPLSLDEAYVDVSDCTQLGGIATHIAQHIRAQVEREVGLTVSAGVAPNKFLAKIASDWNKPNGLTVIRPEQVDAFVLALPVQKLFGVGPKLAERLNSLNLHTCADIRQQTLSFMQLHFGKMGTHLHQLAYGIDHRQVEINRIRQSISVEQTFLSDKQGLAQCQQPLQALWLDLVSRIAKHAQSHPTHQLHKLVVKIKSANFDSHSIETLAPEVALTHFTQHLQLTHFQPLLAQLLFKFPSPIRLLGIGIRLKVASDGQQLFLPL